MTFVRIPTKAPKRVGAGNFVPEEMESTHGVLLHGLKNGDSDAALAFCDTYGPRINRWVWRLLGGDNDHDEVVQQVYVGLFSALPKLRDVSALDAFVDSVTIRTVRKEIRRRKYKRLFFCPTTVVEEDLISDNNRPLKDAHVRAFYRALDKLNTEERLIFVLKHFEGLTMAEIAKLSGLSVRTAKRRLYSGTARLRDLMMKETVLVTMLEEY
ncbi:MAG: sigma-70 family RNA polymerase sigma factor [Deltaproteobacteria bacterium]|nr:sigma-70 family RNA polymerase sigma factor [Deltaproteobacteria bacterium]